jgi:hypothetical protein
MQAVNDTTGCISSSRTAVVITINARPANPVSGGNQTFVVLMVVLRNINNNRFGFFYYMVTAATGGTVVSNPTQVGVGYQLLLKLRTDFVQVSSGLR